MPVTVENPRRHFFADLDSHTGFSDGALLPEVAHDSARNLAKLDVFCLTDHLESVETGEWNRIRALRNGWHLAPDGSDDTHSPNWGNVKSWTWILAPGLSRSILWSAPVWLLATVSWK